MSNMSYCRFQNTSSDLDDCERALDELIGGELKPLSDDELSAAKSLVTTCADIVVMVAEAAGLDLDELLSMSRRRDKLREAMDSINTDAGGTSSEEE